MKKRKKKTSRFREFVRIILTIIAIIWGIGIIINVGGKITDSWNIGNKKKEITNPSKLMDKLKEDLKKLKKSDIKKSGSNK